ncbi:hypothetical protein LWI29_025033 [Acer saccharum]|uniref:CCHC-type domain-containing protein n=1 Tax=Acer saccharum TaxID=4024 RepID=A0AA39VJ82_ACESA|nr:hypothetical protein LWI29_025033 [Acer saccharum]
MARNDLAETEEHMVARYIGGLRVQFQDTLNLFDPYSVAEAHQRVLQLEKQLGRRSSDAFGNIRSNGHNVVTAPPHTRNINNLSPQVVGNNQTNKNPTTSSGVRCFTCGETGHRMSECKKRGNYGKGLFIENEVKVYDMEDEEQDVNAAQPTKELVKGDSGTMLVVRKICFTPKGENDAQWLRHNIFQTTCTIGGKVCRLVIDSGSCKNVISEEAVAKLNLKTEPHQNPYKLSWLKKEAVGETKVVCVLLSRDETNNVDVLETVKPLL